MAKHLDVSPFLFTFAPSIESLRGGNADILVKKGRYLTLSSTSESRKFASEETHTGTFTLGVLYPVFTLIIYSCAPCAVIGVG